MSDNFGAQRLAGKCILVVEDNTFNQMLARQLLELMGASVVIAGHGGMALDLLKASPASFDLILMDVMMPVVDGYQATRQIREQLSLDIPIVAMTAGTYETDRQRCFTAGMNDFVSKPIKPAQMIEAIERQLAGRSTASSAPCRPDSATGDADRFDPNQIAESLGGNLELVAELAGEFLRNCLLLQHDCREAMVRGDATLIDRCLGTLKGMAGTFKLPYLMCLAKEAELANLAGESGRDGAIELCLAELNEMLAQIEAWLALRAKPSA